MTPQFIAIESYGYDPENDSYTLQQVVNVNINEVQAVSQSVYTRKLFIRHVFSINHLFGPFTWSTTKTETKDVYFWVIRVSGIDFLTLELPPELEQLLPNV